MLLRTVLRPLKSGCLSHAGGRGPQDPFSCTPIAWSRGYSSGLLVATRNAQGAAYDFARNRRVHTFSDEASSLDISRLEPDPPKSSGIKSHSKHGHAVLSTFDLFSIGVGPSSSHTVGPWRAAGIFIGELERNQLLNKVAALKITLYGSLAATGKGHYTVEGLLMGMQGYDCETCDTAIIQPNYRSIVDTKAIALAGHRSVRFDVEKDIRWRWDAVLPEHPNGMTFTVFDKDGNLLALNEYFSVGGGFVVTPRSLQVGGENVFYKEKDHLNANPARRQQDHGVPSETAALLTGPEASGDEAGAAQSASEDRWAVPPMPFATGADLLRLCEKHNLTIAQIVWENERHYLSDEDIREKLLNIYRVMDNCIREGVTSQETHLPGGLRVKRRAPALYKRLMRGLYPHFPETSPTSNTLPPMNGTSGGLTSSKRPGVAIRGRMEHPLPPTPPRKTSFPAMETLSCYAMAVNEVNASGGRIVTAPTNGASGILPSVGKYIMEFVSNDPESDILTFLLTGSAIGMLIKRGATISGAEGGCMAEVGSATAMAAAGFTAVCGGTPQQILQAAEVGIEHSLGLTCDPIGGLVQIPCVERNAIGSIKAIAAAQIALSGDGEHLISLDEVIVTMQNTAQDMHSNYKETSLGGLAATIKIPVSMPDC